MYDILLSKNMIFSGYGAPAQDTNVHHGEPYTNPCNHRVRHIYGIGRKNLVNQSGLCDINLTTKQNKPQLMEIIELL